VSIDTVDASNSSDFGDVTVTIESPETVVLLSCGHRIAGAAP